MHKFGVKYEKKGTSISKNELRKGGFENPKVVKCDFSTKSVPTYYDFCNNTISWDPMYFLRKTAYDQCPSPEIV